MLVIVSTPSHSCYLYSHTLHHQHFIWLPGPRTPLRSLLITQGTHDISWIHLPKLKQPMSGIIYFPLMFFLNIGAAIVSSVGLVYTLHIAREIWMAMASFFTCFASQYVPRIWCLGFLCRCNNLKHHGMFNPSNSLSMYYPRLIPLGMSIVCFSHCWSIPSTNSMPRPSVMQIREYFSKSQNSLEMQVSREVDRAFPQAIGSFSTRPASNSLAWSNKKDLSKA